MAEPKRCPDCGEVVDLSEEVGIETPVGMFGCPRHVAFSCAENQANQWEMAAFCERQARERAEARPSKNLIVEVANALPGLPQSDVPEDEQERMRTRTQAGKAASTSKTQVSGPLPEPSRPALKFEAGQEEKP